MSRTFLFAAFALTFVAGLFAPQAIERLQIGAQVGLSVLPLGVDGEGKPCLRPVFDLLEDRHG